MSPPTKQQVRVLHVIDDYLTDNGFPPTIREIGAALGLASSSTIHWHLAALERGGYVERSHLPRALRLTDRGWGYLEFEEQHV